MTKEFDNYPPAQPKATVNWQKVWDKFADAFGNVFGWGSGAGVVLGLIAGIIFGITSCSQSFGKADEWAFQCRADGNQVFSMVNGPSYCMAEAQVLSEPKSDVWGNFDSVACTAQGGYSAKNVNGNSYSYYCVKGKVVSKSP